MITERELFEALRGVTDPELGRDIVELDMVRDLSLEDGKVSFTLALTTLACPFKEEIVSQAKAAVVALDGIKEVNVNLAEMTPEEKKGLFASTDQRGKVEHLNEIDRAIAVMSGKGGVGKSSVAALLAVALRSQGRRVGILDADITGPSIPKMFFPLPRHPVGSPLAILPVESKGGIKVMSINLLLPHEDDAVIWRGPLISGAIKQFWGDVLWGTLDYLLVDLPPGTSDASLTVMQSLPLEGVLLVTSPQDLAGMVVRKAAQMARQVGTPLLGLIENMSYFLCPDTGKRHEVFGPSHAEETASRLGIPFLGRLPLDPYLARMADAGRIEEYESEVIEEIARRIGGETPTDEG